MGIVADLLQNIELPRMVRVRQHFPADVESDVVAAVSRELCKPEIAALLKPGMKIAVAVGSRGMAEIPQIARAVVAELRKIGTAPFLVPGMGKIYSPWAITQASATFALSHLVQAKCRAR